MRFGAIKKQIKCKSILNVDLGELGSGWQGDGVDTQSSHSIRTSVHESALKDSGRPVRQFSIDSQFRDHGLVWIQHRQIHVRFVHTCT